MAIVRYGPTAANKTLFFVNVARAGPDGDAHFGSFCQVCRVRCFEGRTDLCIRVHAV